MPVAAEQDVLRLEIPVDDTVGVQELKGSSDLGSVELCHRIGEGL